MRLDKWLWAARFFKTRSIASHACDLGRIHSNSIPAKPAREVRVGDQLHIKTGTHEYVIDVLELSEMRGPAAAAQKLYVETEASREARAKLAEAHKALAALDMLPDARPSKKDRRLINRLRGR